MALTGMVGFELGDASELVSVSGSVTVLAAAARNGGYGARITGNAVGVASTISLPNSINVSGQPTCVPKATLTAGFAARFNSLPADAGTYESFLTVYYTATVRAELRIGADGRLQLVSGMPDQLPVAYSPPLVLGNWRYVELTVAGAVLKAALDGRVFYNGSNPDGVSPAYVMIGKRSNLASQGYVVNVDDLYTRDDATFLGPSVRVVRLAPTALGLR